MENILLGLILGLFLEGKNHETSRHVPQSISRPIHPYCQPFPQKELCRQSDEGRNSSVSDAMPQPDYCKQEGLR